MKKISIHTDLACERCKIDENDNGTEFTKEDLFDCEKQTLKIKSREASEKYDMPVGTYTTLITHPLHEMDEADMSTCAQALSQIISEYLQSSLKSQDMKGKCILVAGLGNRYLTSDAVGPLSIKNISATNHIAEYDGDVFAKYFHSRVITLSPGVMSQTGMESSDIIRGICEKAHPDAVIVIDALAARSCERLATTIQLCDTGITPGSGIHNARCALNEQTLGCPTIAIGVPTVVDTSTLVLDALEKAQKSDISDDIFPSLNAGSFFVSPKECDALAENAAFVISSSINSVLNKNLFN